MARRKSPLFLARATYRRRRLRDASRLLPIVGGFLLLLPLLWTEESQLSLSAMDVIYFFGVWLLLIGAAAAFASGLHNGQGTDGDED